MTIISLPSTFTSDIVANMSQLFTDLNSYITLVIGVLLAVVVVEVIIGAIRAHR